MTLPSELESGLRSGQVIPYLGPAMLALQPDYAVPASPEALVALITAKVTVPHKIRGRLTQAAQFIENFKHRKTLVAQMDSAFAAAPASSPLHRHIAALRLPLIVDSWYDAATRAALSSDGVAWGEVQGLSQAEHFGTWTGWYDAAGNLVPERSSSWETLLYKPIGAHLPASNYLVSDSDYVEVLTEIDIQTPIPAEVQQIRSSRGFLFLGCRFNDQLTRSFARQIMKRSAGPHWAVLPDSLTRMEEKFLAEQSIQRIEMTLPDFSAALIAAVPLAA